MTADRRSDEQIRLLTGRGATCVHGPAIKTHPLGSDDDLRAATEALIADPPDLVVLSTGIGVRSWLEAADAMHLGDQLHTALSSAELVTRGPKAVGALVTAGFEVAWNAPNARYLDILTMLAERGVVGARIGVQLDGAVDQRLCSEIEALGARAVPVPVYRWSTPSDPEPAARLVTATCEGRIDGLTFTARPAVENFLQIAKDLDLVDQLRERLASRTAYFCVGPVCAGGFDDAGFGEAIYPERTRLGALVQLVTKHFASQAVEVEIGGLPVRIQGRSVTVGDDEPASLSDRERSVLMTLLERPGSVQSKQSLLDRVWGGGESDVHVVEVTVARLRGRLGPAGVGIETVIRRGYRISHQ